jgi:hypothetical protein
MRYQVETPTQTATVKSLKAAISMCEQYYQCNLAESAKEIRETINLINRDFVKGKFGGDFCKITKI